MMNNAPTDTTHLVSPFNRQESKVRVLLIEDDVSYAGLVGILLRANLEQECELVNAYHLADGLAQLAKRDDFDVVLLDLTLPDSEGLTTLNQVLRAFPEQTVVVLTGFDDPSQGIKAVQAGAQDYLVKNEFEPTELSRVIRFSMERRRVLLRLEEAQRIAKIGNWEVRPYSNYFYASKEVYRMLGIPSDTTYDYTDLLLPDNPFHLLTSQLIHREEEAVSNSGERFEVILADSSMSYLTLNSRCLKTPEGEMYCVGTIQDVSEAVATEALQHAQELSDQAARTREQVMANVSHELRTPMNAIMGMSNLLKLTPSIVNKRSMWIIYRKPPVSYWESSTICCRHRHFNTVN
ncbi:MAG: response regulator [Saprospiraceae bacterium]